MQAMDAMSLQPIVAFLAQVAPFCHLTVEQQEYCASKMTIRYLAADGDILHVSRDDKQLYLVRTGAIELSTSSGTLLDRLGRGDYWYPASLVQAPSDAVDIAVSTLKKAEPTWPSIASPFSEPSKAVYVDGGHNAPQYAPKIASSLTISLTVLEDALIYIVPSEVIEQLCHSSTLCRTLFQPETDHVKRADSGVLAGIKSHDHLSVPIKDVMSTPLQMQPESQSVTEISQFMTQQNISAVVLYSAKESPPCLSKTVSHVLSGIVTDRDLRRRVLARNRLGAIPARDIMSQQVHTISASAPVYEALLLMGQHNLHHLPVMEHGIPVGMVTDTDLLRLQGYTPLALLAKIDRQPLSGLVRCAEQIPHLVEQLLVQKTPAAQVSRWLTLLADAITRRLLVLAQQVLGPPPMVFCWLAFGSQARGEMVLGSDQDNGLLLAEEPDVEQADYFIRLGKWVCDGLALCGYPYCPGNIMAQSAQHCLSLPAWQQCFTHWIEQPSPEALLSSSIFFDMRCISGDAGLYAALKQTISLAGTNDIFLAALAHNCLLQHTPLGFFRQWVLEHDGAQSQGIDLKHRGSMIINDIVRVHSLSGAGLDGEIRYAVITGCAGFYYRTEATQSDAGAGE
ncbi:cyclic nucleotide-binding protein [Shewanella sp. NFH-SH190041]|nr:DUF294 nucleotidyltransferase-like domain-containing protein [Shewanella sp. NFH-SH190041]BDM64926.1 cyclic nucleotide-binding protein [Shewanella sp. NFH-SH190041]